MNFIAIIDQQACSYCFKGNSLSMSTPAKYGHGKRDSHERCLITVLLASRFDVWSEIIAHRWPADC